MSKLSCPSTTIGRMEEGVKGGDKAMELIQNPVIITDGSNRPLGKTLYKILQQPVNLIREGVSYAVNIANDLISGLIIRIVLWDAFRTGFRSW